MTTAANADIAGIKLNLVDKIGSDKNVSTDDVKWTLIGGRFCPSEVESALRISTRVDDGFFRNKS